MAIFKRSSFSMDALEGIFEGYSDGETWNGWACPYFEYLEAERVLTASEKNGFVWSYDASHDRFIVRLAKDDPAVDAPETFEARTIGVGNTTIKVYPVGAYFWIWEECTS